MVVEGFMRMVRDVSSVAHQALIANSGGGALGYNSTLSNVYGPSGASLNTSTTAIKNVVLGKDAAAALKDGDGGNTVIGNSALYLCPSGSWNTAVGQSSLHNLQGEGAIGAPNSANSSNNVAVGNAAFFTLDKGSRNVAVGSNAAALLVDGSFNVAVGFRALQGSVNTATATHSVAIGYEALRDVSGALGAVAIGSKALRAGGHFHAQYGNNTVTDIAIGKNALQFMGQDGSGGNTAVGNCALCWCPSGSWNTAVGNGALYNLIGEGDAGSPNEAQSSRNVAIGNVALYNLTTGSKNTAVGAYAADSIADGSFNVAVGHSALRGRNGGAPTYHNTAVGYEALKDVSGGTYNVAVGSYAFAGAGGGYAPKSLDGSYNVAIGARAGGGVAGAATGHYSHNTWVGGMAAHVPWGANPGQTDSVSNSVAVGFEALFRARGNGSVAVGYKAMKGDGNYGGPFGSPYNTAVGYEALRDVSGASGAVAIGNKALRAGGNHAIPGVTGNNVAVGERALEELGDLDGSGGNVALGGCALCQSISGGWNTALGNGALYNNTGGNYNVGVGAHALYSLVSGSNNTALGRWAGRGMSTGNFDGLLILNATGNDFPTGLSTDVSNAFFVKPVREASQSSALYYNPTSGEVTHSGAGSAFSSGGYGSKWITATDASNNGWNAHPYGGSGPGTSPVSLGTLTGLHESDILAAFASGTHAMRARITIYGAGGGGGGGTSGSTGSGRNGQGGGSGAMYTFINYDVSATLWDNSAGLLGLAGGGSPGAAPGQFESAYGTGGGAGGGPPPTLIAGGNTPAAGSASNPIGYVPTFYDALWNSYHTATTGGYGIGGGGGGRGGYQNDATAGGGTPGQIQGPTGTALTPHLGNWRVPTLGATPLPGNVNNQGAAGSSTTSWGPSYVAQPGAAAGLLLTNSPFLSKNAWGTDGGVAGKGNQGPYGAGGANAWSFPALPGGDAKYSAGGGGGGASFQWSTEAGKRGGKGGDALMIIEWWL